MAENQETITTATEEAAKTEKESENAPEKSTEYADVEIPDKLFTDGGENKDEEQEKAAVKEDEAEKAKEAEAAKEPDKDKEPAPAKYKVGEEEITEDELTELKSSGLRLQDYTKKTQELAQERGKLEPMFQLVKTLTDEKADKQLISDIRDMIALNLDEKAAELFDAVLKLDGEKFPNPWKEKAEAAEAKLSQIESQKAIDDEIKQLRKDMGISQKQADEVFEYVVQKYEKEGIALSLSDGYRLMNFDKLKEERAKEPEKKPEKPAPKAPSKERGAKTMQTAKTGGYEDVDLSNYDLIV